MAAHPHILPSAFGLQSIYLSSYLLSSTISGILNWNDPFDGLTKKCPGPNIQGAFISNKEGHFPAHLFHIKVIHSLPQQMPEFISSQWIVVPIITRLTHPGFKVTDSDLREPARIPCQVIPVAALYARLPSSAKDRMELPCKKIR